MSTLRNKNNSNTVTAFLNSLALLEELTTYERYKLARFNVYYDGSGEVVMPQGYEDESIQLLTFNSFYDLYSELVALLARLRVNAEVEETRNNAIRAK